MSEVTDRTFERDVLFSNRPVLVHFWAPWCEECRFLSPWIIEAAQEFAEIITVVAVNVDENPQVAFQYAIALVPTLILFESGGEVHRIKGLTSQQSISRMISGHVSQSQTPSAPSSDKPTEPHHVLGVKTDATPAEITAAYRRLAQMYHPDKVESLAPEYGEIAKRKMLEINVAYDLLMRKR